MEAINIPSLNKNTVYRRVGDVWEVSSEYTPGMGNTAESYQAMISAVTPTDVVISEVMAGNTSTLQADDGRYYDYIELANLSGADVDIGGWYLSDSVEENMAWRDVYKRQQWTCPHFPETTSTAATPSTTCGRKVATTPQARPTHWKTTLP